MNFRTLSYEKLGAVLRITANRPEVLNAQSRVMVVELDEAFRAGSDDADVRVIIVAGSGAHFSAGHDLGSREELEDQQAHPVGPGIAENLIDRKLTAFRVHDCSNCGSPPHTRSRTRWILASKRGSNDRTASICTASESSSATIRRCGLRTKRGRSVRFTPMG